MTKKNDCIVITGAARGLGLDISKHAIEAGYEVIGIGRSISKEFSSLKKQQRKFIEFDIINISKYGLIIYSA